ncbi:hypothetical protein [Trinickia dinghuensis]|uniref:hypothetical protein n=1 Tax=Trinickia dinghuensis TaxID=2291023 RepID=UPI0011C028EB|nr:hypothetical protein [Trinickia dinghuensis]
MTIQISPYLRRLSRLYDVSKPAVSIVTGRSGPADGAQLFIKKGPLNASLRRQVGGSKWQIVQTVSLTQIQAFERIISDHACNFGDHRAIMDLDKWKDFYHLEDRTISYVDKANQAVPPVAEPTVPCYDCGIVLPLKNITIDHQRPQAGNELEPLCKVFRAMGLTIDGPAKGKGLDAVATWRGQVGGLACQATNTRDAKYTLNDVGTIYYTLCDAASQYGELINDCFDHYINLRPLCGACNKPNRNASYYPEHPNKKRALGS